MKSFRMLKQVVDIITIMLLMINPTIPLNSEGFTIHSYLKMNPQVTAR
jgi:hypothetical protein